MSRFLSKVEVPNATSDKEAVNLGQVKELIDRHVKHPVRLTSVGELEGVYSDNVLTLNNSITKLDGVNVSIGDDILVKDQLDKTQNGIYKVKEVGVAGTPSTVNTRVGYVAADGNTDGNAINNVEVNTTAFEAAMTPTTGEYVFQYTVDGTWIYNGTVVNPEDYGITITLKDGGVLDENHSIVVAYEAETPGTGGVLVRRDDFLKNAHILNNTSVVVMEGDTYADTKWTIVSDGTLIVDAASLVFVKECYTSAGSLKIMHSVLTCDGLTKKFMIPHNMNLVDSRAYILIIKDKNSDYVYGVDKPTEGNEKNSITVEFTAAPEVTEVKFDAYVLALE